MRELDASEALVLHHRRDAAARPAAQVVLVRADAGRQLRHERAQAGEHEAEAVVLRGDLNAARAQVHDGMVAAAVAELELLDIRARRLGDHLVPQADAEHGHLPQQLLHLGVRALDGLGVARAVRQEHAVGSHGQHLGRRGVPRHAGHAAAGAHEVFEDGALRSAVVGDHFEARLGRRGERERPRSRQVVGREAARTRARHRGGQVLPDDGCARAHFRQKAGLVDVDGGQHGPLCAAVAHMAHERAGVHPFDGHHAVVAQVVGQALRAAPVRRRRAQVAHDEAAQGGLVRLRVVHVHAVVSDLGIRHRHDLARVRRVGDHLEVALERGVEADLAEHLPRRRARRAAEHGAVLQHERRGRARGLRRPLHQPLRNLAQASILPFGQRPYKKAPPSDVGGARMQGVCCAPCRSLRTALKDRSVVYAYNEFYRLEMQYFLLFEYFYAFIRNDAERRAQLPTVGRSIPSAAGARVPKKRRAACDSSRNVAFFRTVSACIESNHCKLPDHRLALFRVDENAPSNATFL